MTTECSVSKLQFQGLGRRRVEAEFNGGQITSDAGGLLLREVESRYGFIQRLQDLRISTSTRGGTYLTVGERLARMLEEYPNRAIGRVEALPSDGSIEKT